MILHTIDVDFFEVKSDFRDIVREGKDFSRYGSSCHTSRLSNFASNPDASDSWEGGSASDTVRWMDEGYKAPEFKNAGRLVNDSKKRRRTYRDDDGYLNLDRLYAGEEKFLERKEKRNVKPGMTIRVQYAFACAVNAEDIRKYGAFVAGLCGALEKQGIDLEVTVDSMLDGLYREKRGVRSTVRCLVKKRGQKSRFHSWSCLFSPTGYRHIMFHAYHVAGAKENLHCVPSLGTTLAGQKWGVEYDRENNEVTITCNQRAKIDLDALNNDAKKHGLI